MRYLKLIAPVFMILVSCRNYESNQGAKSFAVTINEDTINIIDANGLKQGIWIEQHKDTVVYSDDTATSQKAVFRKK